MPAGAFRETVAFFFYINLYWAFTSMYGAIPALQPKLTLLQLNINEGVHGLSTWCMARWLVEEAAELVAASLRHAMRLQRERDRDRWLRPS